jgi:hypothetical protein
MALSQHSTKVAVLASLAAGVAIALASGPLRADRDVNLELLAQVEALAQNNERLSERLSLQQAELAEALGQLAALRMAAGNTSKPPSSSSQAPAGKTLAQALAEERAAFRAKALEALKPEFDAIQVQLAGTVPKTVYDKHTHEYTAPSVGGWGTLAVVMANPDNLLPYMPPEKVGKGSPEKFTSRPR